MRGEREQGIEKGGGRMKVGEEEERRESDLPRSRRAAFVPLSSAGWLPAGVGGTHCMVRIITQTEEMNLCRAA